jgi:cytochrome c5
MQHHVGATCTDATEKKLYINPMKQLPPPHLFLLAAAAMTACGFPKTGAAPAPLSPAQVATAVAKSPAVSEQSLATGHDLFIAKCNGCHGYPDLGSIAQEKWPAVMKRMAGKAHLNGSQGDDVLHFVVAARSESTSTP